MEKKKLGALWLRQSQAGKHFMTGELEIEGEKIQIVAFQNDKGDNEKRPDYQIFESEPREHREEISPEDAPF